LTLGIFRAKNRSWELIIWVMATVSLAYGGTYAFTSCIMGFGAVVATGLGIVRKLMSVLLSFILFPKPFGVAHFLGLLSFFSGLLVAWSADYNKATGGAPGGGGSRSEGGEGSSGGSDSSDEESSGRVRKVRTSPRLAQMQQLKEGAKAAAAGMGGSQSQQSQNDLPCGPQG
jgi:hypothetical protein